MDILRKAADFVRSKDSRKPSVGIILGSGLGKLADGIANATVIPYGEIPGFPLSTAVGHKGNLLIGELSGKTVIAMQGRFHYYEGYTMQQVTMPVRVMKLLGAEYLFVSNAAGGLDPDFKVGDLMLITDHINMVPSPLIGPNLDEFGVRFPDMTRSYDRRLIELLETSARQRGISIRKGTYIVVTGPTYETPAECKAYHVLGGDAIGMSTVPEVIVARHCGLRVMGMSIITDVAKDFSKEGYENDADEVVRVADAAADRMSVLFSDVLAAL